MWWIIAITMAIPVITSFVVVWSALNSKDSGFSVPPPPKNTKAVTKFNGVFYYNVEE